MKKFLLKLFYFSIPLLILLIIVTILYIKRDIYQDFAPYQYNSMKYRPQLLGDISTKKLLNSTTKYNSFILGSSRSMSLYACYMQQKIKNSTFFHYASCGETIGGIAAKLNLIEALGYEIDNVVIYFDTDFTFLREGECRTNDHYLLTKDNKISYYFSHYKNFIPPQLSLDKIKILLNYKEDTFFKPNTEMDIITNDVSHICSDSILTNYGNATLKKFQISKIDALVASGFFYEREKTTQYKEIQISDSEKNMLQNIKAIFQKHKTNYYIIISPLYDQLKFNIEDMNTIQEIFGNRVYDFSGINSYTNNVYNYIPERNHFRNYISKFMIDSIFQEESY